MTITQLLRSPLVPLERSARLDERPLPLVQQRTARPPRRLRLALFSGNYNYLRDGANQALNKLVEHAETQLGASVRVYSPTTETPAFAPKGTLVSMPSIPIPGRSEFRIGLGLSPAARRDLEAFAPNLVHLSAPDLLGSAALRWAKARGLPVVTSVHTRFETYADYYRMGWLRPAIERRLASFYRQSDFLLVPSAAVQAEMTAAGWNERIRVWGRGVDRTLFNPTQRDMDWRRAQGYADDEVVICFLGRLVLEKGIDRFAAVINDLETRGLKLRPLIIGEGPARAHFASLLPDAAFTGFLSGHALGRALASADILLMPSKTEAFGNVVLESMAAGVAVVSTDAPSARVLIEQGVSGLLCADATCDYADAIERLIANSGERKAIGEQAARRARCFEWHNVLNDAMTVYKEALSDTHITVRATAPLL